MKLRSIFTHKRFSWNFPPKYQGYRVRVQDYHLIWIGVIGVFGGGTMFYYSHLESVPFSSRTRFIAISEATEDKLGEQAWKDIIRNYSSQILPSNHPTTLAVAKVANSLISVSKLSKQKWDLVVIHDPLVNAFSIPGGKLVVFTGILKFANTSDRLAAVLGHEIAHQIARHSGEAISSNFVIGSLALLATMVFDLPHQVVRMTEQFIFKLPKSRQMENEADYIGTVLLARACYDPYAAVEFWRDMKKSEQSKLLSFFSTHPGSDERIENLISYQKEAENIRLESECSMVISINLGNWVF